MEAAHEATNVELERTWGVRLWNRIGVNTGEVVAGDPALRQRLVTGDVVNVAARLEQVANSGEVLLGASTFRLVRGAIEVEEAGPYKLKGKAEPVTAYRVLAVRAVGDPLERHLEAPLVGRRRELDILNREFERTAEGLGRSLTVIGSAGVGKTRLTEEFLRSAAGAATVLRGRCLSYGQGVTFWPLASALRQAAGIADDDEASVALSKLALLLGEPDPAVLDPIASVMRLSEEIHTVDDTAWAARELVARMAQRRPIVVFFEDLHWAEPAFIDLVGRLASVEARLLVLTTARPEFEDDHPQWRPDVTIRLEALDREHVKELLDNLLGTTVPRVALDAISRASEGNPLFVEQIVAMWVDDGILARDNGTWRITGPVPERTIPESISALLLARLDRLEHEELSLLQHASVIGQEFDVKALAALSTERRPSSATLVPLVGKGFLKRLDEPGEMTFRFGHILIREAAYEGLLKRTRAELHLTFATWLESRAEERFAELEEIIGYHLEQAYLYRVQLAPEDEESHAIALRAAELLGGTGRRATFRGDLVAAAGLFRRAVSLLRVEESRRVEFLPHLAYVLVEIGEFDEAQGAVESALAEAAAAGDELAAAHAELGRQLLRRARDPEGWTREGPEPLRRTIETLTRLGDDLILGRALFLLAFHEIYAFTGPVDRMHDLLQRSAHLVGSAGDRAQEAFIVSHISGMDFYLKTPAKEGIRRARTILSTTRGSRTGEANTRANLGGLLAMAGEFDEGREELALAKALYEELGTTAESSVVAVRGTYLERLAGDLPAAERWLRWSDSILAPIGERMYRGTVLPLLARVLVEDGRVEEAEQVINMGRQVAAPDDQEGQYFLLQARARVASCRGKHDEAVLLATQGRDRIPDHMLHSLGDAGVDLGVVLLAAGRGPEAIAALETALDCYARKGNIPATARARALLADALASRSMITPDR
jgi:tetratricopeptide (TPR) repeat protein